MNLHIASTEQMASRIKEVFPEDEILAWSDALYEGPVRDEPLKDITIKRARYFCDVGLGDENELISRYQRIHQQMSRVSQYNEVNMWFSDNLFDQLQLIQLLNWMSDNETGRTAFNLIQRKQLEGLERNRLYELWDKRVEVSMLQISIGKDAWQRLCAVDPRDLQNFAYKDLSIMPFVKPALHRLLQQFPSQMNGLNRSERQILEMVSAGEAHATEIYNGAQKKEEVPFMSRAIFTLYLNRFIDCDEPLLSKSLSEREGKSDWCFTFTELGRNVLRYKADWLQVNGINRWVGGVHLQPGMIWRWDPKRQQLIRTYT